MSAQERPSPVDREPEVDPNGPLEPRLGAARATRRTVVTAAAAALGSVGLAGCSVPASSPQASPASSRSTGSTRPPSSPGSAGSGGGPSSSASTAHGATAGAPAGSGDATPALLESPGPDVRTGPVGAQRVALTFHGAGAPALTLRVLDTAKAHAAKVTVFAVGTWLNVNPSLGRAILAGGHDLGNHTYSHRPMRRLTASEADLEVRRGAAAVAAVRGSAGLLFRPSGTQLSTSTIRAAALAAGYHRCVSYDVDPLDYLDPGTTAVRDRTLAAVRDGSIVSLHLGHPGTVAALPGILDGLEQRGLTAVTVTELLGGAT
ncbi:polysaccharide deacetylase family protein [Terrabacter sp. 2RAF25]|uniref:polysaccharide deacetylase family protein n=1 Tax=Terrabacter sp. 2RAF25 TaxID=3232998 RepID=UPI003F9CEFFE